MAWLGHFIDVHECVLGHFIDVAVMVLGRDQELQAAEYDFKDESPRSLPDHLRDQMLDLLIACPGFLRAWPVVWSFTISLSTCQRYLCSWLDRGASLALGDRNGCLGTEAEGSGITRPEAMALILLVGPMREVYNWRLAGAVKVRNIRAIFPFS